MDQIHDKLIELGDMGAVESSTVSDIRYDRRRLYDLGYTMFFENDAPQFMMLGDTHCVYNSILYFGRNAPRTSLQSLEMIIIKQSQFSPT